MKRPAGIRPLLSIVVTAIFLLVAACDNPSEDASSQASTAQTDATQADATQAGTAETDEGSQDTEESADAVDEAAPEAAPDTSEESSEEAIEETTEAVETGGVTSEENPVVIRLGDYEERLSDFDEQFEIAMMGVAAQQGSELSDEVRAQLSIYKPQFLDQRATELALLDEAEARGLSVSEEELEAQVATISEGMTEEQSFEDIYTEAGFASEEAFRDYLSNQLLIEQLVGQLQEAATVSEEDVASAYEARAEEFVQGEQVCARHILLETEEDANAVLTELEGGADFAELAQERSTGPSGPNGGDLSCFTQDRMVAPFGEAAFAAELDEPVGPVQTEFGYHVILVYDRQEAGQTPLEQVAPQLEQELSQEAFISSIDAIRADSGVEVFPEVLEPATLPPETTEDASVEGGVEDGVEGGAEDIEDTPIEETTEEDTEDSE